MRTAVRFRGRLEALLQDQPEQLAALLLEICSVSEVAERITDGRLGQLQPRAELVRVVAGRPATFTIKLQVTTN